LIISDFKELNYICDTKEVPEGNYSIKIVVSDRIDNGIWISSQKYAIRHLDSHINIMTLIIAITILAAGACLGLFNIRKRILKNKIRNPEKRGFDENI